MSTVAPFVPHPALGGAHLQTFAGELLPRAFGHHQAWRAARREVVFPLPDGDRLLGYLHLHPDDARRQRPVVVHLHGLEGSARATYQQGLSSKAFAAGFHSLRLNYRTCGGSEHLASNIYTGGCRADLVAVFRQLREDWGFARLHATGVSLGANLLLRLLGEAAPPGLERAVAVSPPISMRAAGEALARAENRMYELYFLVQLKARLRRMARRSPDPTRVRAVLGELGGLTTLRAFDDRITAPLGGYADAAAYYSEASSGEHLASIQVPTLIVHAQDDPFLPFTMYAPYRELLAGHPQVATAFPEQGGHVGFVAAPAPRRAPWMDARWSENEAIAFLGAP